MAGRRRWPAIRRTSAGQRAQGGVEPIRAAWRTIFERVPSLRVTPVEMIANGDRVAVWARVERDCGEPATMMELIRVADGRIAELWGLSTLSWR